MSRQDLAPEPNETPTPEAAAQMRSKRIGQWVGLVLLGGLALAALIQRSLDTSPKDAAASPETLYVQASTLRCREQPDVQSALVQRLPRGVAVQTVERRGDWTRIARGTTSCWTVSRYLRAEPVEPVQSAAASRPPRAAKSARQPTHAPRPDVDERLLAGRDAAPGVSQDRPDWAAPSAEPVARSAAQRGADASARSAEPPEPAQAAEVAKSAPVAESRPRRRAAAGASLYANCSEARAAGAAPVREGDPGYSRRLDRDGDGVGCE